jgi:hypothetical protein
MAMEFMAAGGVPASDTRRLLNRAQYQHRRYGGGAPKVRSWTFQEPQIERPEHQDDPDVHHQPLPEPIPEEQDVHTDHDGYQREHVKHDGCLSSHPSFLLRAAESATVRGPRGWSVIAGQFVGQRLPQSSSTSRFTAGASDDVAEVRDLGFPGAWVKHSPPKRLRNASAVAVSGKQNRI